MAQYILLPCTYRNEAFVDLPHITSLLHGDEAKMILLIDPAQESFVVVEEDSSGFGPAIVTTGISQHPDHQRNFYWNNSCWINKSLSKLFRLCIQLIKKSNEKFKKSHFIITLVTVVSEFFTILCLSINVYLDFFFAGKFFFVLAKCCFFPFQQNTQSTNNNLYSFTVINGKTAQKNK